MKSYIGRLSYLLKQDVPPTNFNDGTYQQLVNSGGLKYIHSSELKDSMANYAAQLKRLVNFNRMKYADRTAYLFELNSLDAIHDYVDVEKIPEMMTYPTLTILSSILLLLCTCSITQNKIAD